MANVVYIVKCGIWSDTAKQFLLSPYYYSSLKKASDVRARILRDDKATDIIEAFTPDLYIALVEATDYKNDKGEKARVMIEKETVW
jgi:hypothetical protein